MCFLAIQKNSNLPGKFIADFKGRPKFADSK